MPLVNILDTLLLQPLLFMYQEILGALLDVAGGPGWALVAFSVVLNLILLPVYYQMERAGREHAVKRATVENEVERMKAHYDGRERYFYIRAVHRQYRYRPIGIVLASGALYLQVLVFATVFRYIADLEVLDGAAFIGIPDLSEPDRLLLGINLLPILMTIANVLSVMVYGESKSQRRQSFVMAAVFLVVLYPTPSGLVLYWTANNVFSLTRNAIEHKVGGKLPTGLKRRWVQFANQE